MHLPHLFPKFSLEQAMTDNLSVITSICRAELHFWYGYNYMVLTCDSNCIAKVFRSSCKDFSFSLYLSCAILSSCLNSTSRNDKNVLPIEFVFDFVALMF